MKVWKEYEKKLLNEENEWSDELNVEKIEGHCEKVSVKAVTEGLNLMKAQKTAGTIRVIFELLKVCKNESVKKLAQVVGWWFTSRKRNA